MLFLLLILPAASAFYGVSPAFRELSVPAGGSATIRMSVNNGGPTGMFRLSLLGEAAPFSRLDPEAAQIDAGAYRFFDVIVSSPRDAVTGKRYQLDVLISNDQSSTLPAGEAASVGMADSLTATYSIYFTEPPLPVTTTTAAASTSTTTTTVRPAATTTTVRPAAVTTISPAGGPPQGSSPGAGTAGQEAARPGAPGPEAAGAASQNPPAASVYVPLSLAILVAIGAAAFVSREPPAAPPRAEAKPSLGEVQPQMGAGPQRRAKVKKRGRAHRKR